MNAGMRTKLLRLIENEMSGLAGSASPFVGSLYRSVGISYATRKDIITGIGAKIHGGRWNPPRTFAAVYASLSPDQSLKESIATHRNYGVSPDDLLPITTIAIDVKLSLVLDMHQYLFRENKVMYWKSILNEDWGYLQEKGVESISQTIGRLSFEMGLEAILVPSSQVKKSSILVYFPQRKRKGSRFRVVNRNLLPP